MLQIKNDFWEVEKFIIENESLVIWGTGSSFYRTEGHFNGSLRNKVDYFIETDPQKDEFLNKPLISSHQMLQDQDDIKVIVCSSFIVDIVKFLEPFAESRDITIYIASVLSEQNWGQRYFNYFNQLLNQELLIGRNNSSNEDDGYIGVYIHNWKGWIAPYYSLTLGILLKSKGMNVRFIFEDIDDHMSHNYTNYLHNTLHLLSKIKKKWNIPFDFLSSFTEKTLSDNQKKKIDKVVDFSLVSFNRKLLNFIDENQQDLLIQNNLSQLSERLNNYFDYYKFKTVFATTNVHYSLGVVQEICQSKNIHTTSAELIRGGYSYSITGPAIQQNDIPLLISQLGEDEVEKLLLVADKHINNIKPKGTEPNKKTDYILIPLNIYWDSATLARDDIFNNDDLEWLESTISFILENTTFKIIVRQHPHEKIFGTGEDLKQYLKQKFGNYDNFIFIDCDNDISTYDLIQYAKVILPSTSTVGIEAICLNKTVVTKSKVYYADSDLCVVSNSKEEYFKNILDVINKKDLYKPINISKAKLYLVLTLLNRIKTNLTHHYYDMSAWICDKSLESLYEECEENGVFEVFESKVPILLTQLRRNLLGENYKLHFTDDDI